MLPIWDMDLTVKEMTRLIDQGIRGFTLSDKPELLGLPELPEPYFDPMWDLFNETGRGRQLPHRRRARREDMEALRSVDAASSAGPASSRRSPTPIPTVAASTWRSFGPQRKLAVHGDADVHEQRAHHRQPVHAATCSTATRT